MSTVESNDSAADESLAVLPEFELSYMVDDRERPSEVTIFHGADDADISTHWLTADADAAISLEDVR